LPFGEFISITVDVAFRINHLKILPGISKLPGNLCPAPLFRGKRSFAQLVDPSFHIWDVCPSDEELSYLSDIDVFLPSGLLLKLN